MTATVGFGGALNVGMGAATIKVVSTDIGRGESTELRLRASLGIAMIGGAALSVLVIFIYLFAGDVLLGKMGESQSMVRSTAFTAAVLLWLEQIDNVASSSMKGAERFGNAARLEIIGKGVQIGLAVLATWHSPTLAALYFALVSGALIRLTAKLMVARQLLGLTTWRPSLHGAADVLHFAAWGWLQGIGSVLFGVADRMVVGAMLGATSLAYYSIASQLAMQVHAISAAGLSVIFPLVSRKLEGSNKVKLLPLARLTIGGNLVLSSALAVGLLLLAPLILEPWIGSEAAAAVGRLLPWLIGAYWLLALNVAPFYMLLGMGRVRFVGLTVLGAGVVGIGAMWETIRMLGFYGSPAGRGIYALVSLVLLMPIAQHLLRERRDGLRRRLARKQVDPILDHEPAP